MKTIEIPCPHCAFPGDGQECPHCDDDGFIRAKVTKEELRELDMEEDSE